MNIHEYQAKRIFKDYGINVANGAVCENLEQAAFALGLLNEGATGEDFSGENLGISLPLKGEIFAVKAQIHAGGRALAGGVKLAKGKERALQAAKELLHSRLITPQTPPGGLPVDKIYVEEALKFNREIYLSLAFDRNAERLALIVSKQGGTSVEQIASEHPEFIKKISIDPQIGLCDFHAQELVKFLELDKERFLKFYDLLGKIYKIYVEKDANLIEINPLVQTDEGEFYATDAKISFDDSALFRRPEIAAFADPAQSDASENIAKSQKLNYVKLDGDVGCVVNGAGLAMATMDIIKELGGKAANFLDVGGGATSEGVARAFGLILKDERVRVIFVNIFGGIVRCDRIAQGILQACESLNLSIPVVIRLDGTNAEAAREILRNSGLKGLHASENLLDGAKLAVSLARANLGAKILSDGENSGGTPFQNAFKGEK